MAKRATKVVEEKPEMQSRRVNGKLRYYALRICDTCGESQTIPASSATLPSTCKRCSDMKRRGTAVIRRRTGEFVKCGHCHCMFYRRQSEGKRKFCSRACANIHKTKYAKTARQCKTCGCEFMHSDRPNSNSRGIYCSVKCRDAAYIGVYRGCKARNTKSHRPGWSSISRKFRSDDNNFCSRCGKTGGRLAVHHVDPYWRSKNNHSQNLVTLCPKCHGKLEKLSEQVARLPVQKRKLAVAIIQATLHDLWHLHQGRRLMQPTESSTGESRLTM